LNEVAKERLFRLLMERPFPDPIIPADLEGSGVELDSVLAGSIDLSPQELVRIFLGSSPGNPADRKRVRLLATISLLRRLCATTARGEVAGRFLVDSYQTLEKTASAFALGMDLTEKASSSMAELERFWIHFACYPDLESEKREQGMTNDLSLRESARRCVEILDTLWSEIVESERA
jgi:hypothetical protein